jgi:hypothetical protein
MLLTRTNFEALQKKYSISSWYPVEGEISLAQRRKDAKKTLNTRQRFAPLRETSSTA